MSPAPFPLPAAAAGLGAGLWEPASLRAPALSRNPAQERGSEEGRCHLVACLWGAGSRLRGTPGWAAAVGGGRPGAWRRARRVAVGMLRPGGHCGPGWTWGRRARARGRGSCGAARAGANARRRGGRGEGAAAAARGRRRLSPGRPSAGSSPRNRPPTAARGSRLPTPEPRRRRLLAAPGCLRLPLPEPRRRRGGPSAGIGRLGLPGRSVKGRELARGPWG